MIELEINGYYFHVKNALIDGDGYLEYAIDHYFEPGEHDTPSTNKVPKDIINTLEYVLTKELEEDRREGMMRYSKDD
ncbi:MAG: hypothetical protein IPL34_20105 [Thiofilum sp.]|uniref:hypothetical protein n=1 Tax=Thiofilum sp. TaxID=2212733 RepID=UPI0025EF4511|nr:hypothetical protein [Thiofilum sp.]MBK8455586.1 hypothetical protein [Thiofilum sp.]